MQLIELRFQPEQTQTYLGSPSIVRLADGALVASHDYFGPGCPKNHEAEESLTSIYRSEDDGVSWHDVTHIMNCFWSNLFVHQGALYILGCSQQYGSIVIRRSTDGGRQWTHPTDAESGLLFAGGAYREPPNYHCAPMPVLVADGVLYRAFEDCTPNDWGRGFRSLVISAAEDADLLKAASWTKTNHLAFDPDWIPSAWGTLENPGWLEGNMVKALDGTIVDVLRFNSLPLTDKGAIVTLSKDRRTVSFQPDNGFIDIPGGLTKFTIRQHPETGTYLSLANETTVPEQGCQRNVLALIRSQDLLSWQVVQRLLEDDTGMEQGESLRLTGFQYVDWQFDGADIIYLVRTAYRGAHNHHDSNRITFHRLADYASLLTA